MLYSVSLGPAFQQAVREIKTHAPELISTAQYELVRLIFGVAFNSPLGTPMDERDKDVLSGILPKNQTFTTDVLVKIAEGARNAIYESFVRTIDVEPEDMYVYVRHYNFSLAMLELVPKSRPGLEEVLSTPISHETITR